MKNRLVIIGAGGTDFVIAVGVNQIRRKSQKCIIYHGYH